MSFNRSRKILYFHKNVTFFILDVFLQPCSLVNVLFLWTLANSARSDKTKQNVASDQVLHCLLTEVSFEILNKKKNSTQQP